MPIRFRLALALVCLLLALPLTGLGATSPFLLDRQPEGYGVTYRFQHPHFARDLDAELLMGVHELGLEMPVGDNLALSVVLPVAKWGFDDPYDPGQTWLFGNVTTGLHVQNMGSRENMSLLLALQAPTAEGQNLDLYLVGLTGHPSVWQTFLGDVWTLQSRFALRLPAADVGFVHFEAGPELLIPTGGVSGSAQVHLRYGVGVGVETSQLAASIEFGGFYETDGDGEGFNENSAHVLAAGIEYPHGVLRPALYYQIPTDEEFEDFLDGVLGVRFTFKPRVN